MTQTGRTLAIVVAVLAVLVFVGPLIMDGIMAPGMMGGYGGPHGWVWWPGFYRGTFPSGWAFGLALGLRGLVMLVFWGLAIAGVVLLVRWLAGQGSHAETALDVLKRRYAAGEVTREQYEQLRRELER